MKRIIFILVAAASFAACTNYGKKVKSGNIEMYYREGITESEATRAASVLDKIDKEENNNTSTRRSFQLLREGDTITMRMVVDQEKAKDMPDDNFLGIADVMSDSVFNGKPVNMDLTGKTFKTVRHISYIKKGVVSKDEVNVAIFGEKIKEGNVEVYMKGADEEEATAVAKYMNEYFKPESVFSYQLLKDEKFSYTIKMVGNPATIDKLDNTFFAEVCKGVCDVLKVPAVRFEMTDPKFETLKSFNYPADTGDSDLQN